MATHRNRYPGAQPFSDDEFSRKIFFGRERAARVLADKILANHIVTVYARSGLGKTSLLQAGVAPKLREDGFLPLFVRVNDTNIGPFRALLETIPGEAERQDVEYVPGRPESLWSFFKTAEFWRGDLLQTPVLILDQFEELFTLQSGQARAHFLNELSYLTRGLRPPSDTETTPDELSEQPPVVNIVLSLREDCLGYLEEAAEHIPQILDARFRLAPLDLNAAEEAILGPAAVTDPGLDTRPFMVDRTAVTDILDYLVHGTHAPVIGETRHYVEPFQLQLICQRMEQIADARQRESGADMTITMADLGGEAGLTQTLRDFYRQAIDSLPDRRSRRAARRLCEEYLISPEGRRLSLEENELGRNLGLPAGSLGQLVTRRLLRAESRSESTYYELSHDALVEPILASRRAKAQVMGMLGIGAGALLFLLSLLGFVSTPIGAYALATESNGGGDAVLAAVVGVVGGLVYLTVVVTSAILLRGSARSMLRYRLAREPAVAGPNVAVRHVWLAGLSALVGGAMFALFGLIAFAQAITIVLGPISKLAHTAAQVVGSLDYVEHRHLHGIGLDTVVQLVAAVAILAAGWHLCRWGVYRLAGVRVKDVRSAPRRPGFKRNVLTVSRMLLGGIAIVSAVMFAGFALMTVQCGYVAPGEIPSWRPDVPLNMREVDCDYGYYGTPLVYLVFDLLMLTALLLIAIPTLRRGIVAIRKRFARRDKHTEAQRALVDNDSERGKETTAAVAGSDAYPTPRLSQLTSPVSPPSR